MSQPQNSKSPIAVKDAVFLVAVFGKAQNSKIVKGWDALCDATVEGFFGKEPTPAMRAAALAGLNNWEDWVYDFSGLPFNKIIQGDDGTAVEIFRIIDARNVEVK